MIESCRIDTFFEIIETYWNVNCLSVFNIRTRIIEIIETYWNVNQEIYIMDTDSTAK